MKIYSKKIAQSSIELIVLTLVILTFFISFIVIVQDNIQKKVRESTDIKVKQAAANIENEILLASSSLDGYSREFIIPQTINGLNYTILIDDNTLYLNTTQGQTAYVNLKNYTGTLQKGKNIIKKIKGEVFISQ